MFEHPVQKGALKTNIASGLLALDPLVAEDFLTLRQKLPVQRGVSQQVTGIGGCKGSCHQGIGNTGE